MCYHIRWNQDDRPLITEKNGRQPSNENPFTTKSMLCRTPDANSSIKRKSTGKLQELPVLDSKQNESVTTAMKIEEIVSPAVFVESSTAQTCVDRPSYFEERSFMKFAGLETFSNPLVHSNEDTESTDEEIEDIMSAEYSMSSFCTTKAQDTIDADLDKLNIVEVLQAFRADAEAAERAIVMATQCGKLHPKEFREYLRAFMSPKMKDSQNENGFENISQNRAQLDNNQLYKLSRTESAFLLRNKEDSIISNVYNPSEANLISSPKTSLLSMLENADTPIAEEKRISSKFHNTSPIIAHKIGSPATIDNCSENVEEKNIESRVSGKDNEKEKNEESRAQVLKSRTIAMQMAVATAVASVSNINIPIILSTPISTIVHSSISTHPSIIYSANKTVKIPNSVSASIKSTTKNVLSKIPSKIVEVEVEIEIIETGKIDDVFNPRRIMLRTPPKNSSVDSIGCVMSADKGESKELPNLSVSKNVPDCTERNVPDLSCEDVSRRNRSEKVPLILMKNDLCSNIDNWSDIELNRISNVMRRVSMNASDCPNTKNIIQQLQNEIYRLNYEVTNHHEVLAAMNLERGILSQRLLEVNVSTYAIYIFLFICTDVHPFRRC